MQVTKWVPADPDARAANPLAELNTDKRPVRGIPAQAVEAMARKNGWVRLHDLSKREKKRWLEANRRARAHQKAQQLASA